VCSEQAAYLDKFKQLIAAATETETGMRTDVYGLKVLVRYLSCHGRGA
jgi:hypothetical protein